MPRFTYYGQRYALIETEAEILSVTGQEQYADCPQTGSFSCSNEMYNSIHRLIVGAVKSNMQSVFTDCPHREKLGWLVGLQGFEKATERAPAQPPEEAMLIFHGITGARLEGGLRAMMKAGVPRSVYKSIVTAENAKWDLCQLCGELKKEREALDAGEESPHGPAQ